MNPPLLHPGGPTRDALFDLIAGRLHPDAAAWIHVHAQTCAQCTAAMREVSSLHDALEPPPESPFQRQKDLHAVRRRLAAPAPARSRRTLWLSLSSALALAAIAVVAWRGWHAGSATRPAPAGGQTVAATGGLPWTVIARQGAAEVELGADRVVAQAHHGLPSGGALSLPAGSRVVARWGGARVSLEGGASGARVRLEESGAAARVLRLERGLVALDVDPMAPGQTLAVVTADARVTVHGTLFLVEASAAGTRVAVERGVVRVERAGRLVELTAGQQLLPLASAATLADATAAGEGSDGPTFAALRTVPSRDGAETLDVLAAAGARVSVDGLDLGLAPLSLAVTAGPHQVRVSAPGRVPVEQSVEVKVGAPALFDATPATVAAAAEPVPPLRPAAEVLAQARAEVLGGAYPKAIGRLESLRQRNLPPTEAARAALLEAEALRLSHQAERAVRLLERVARGAGTEAEQGQFQLAQTLGRDLLDPRAAAHAWAEANRRFPSGIFREEAAFRLGESLLAAGESRGGVEALERYLAGFPKAAHVEDAHLLVAAARRDRLGDCAGAIPHLRVVARSRGPRAEEAWVGQARCWKSLGRSDEARTVYQRYLMASPRGRFADEARENTR